MRYQAETRDGRRWSGDAGTSDEARRAAEASLGLLPQVVWSGPDESEWPGIPVSAYHLRGDYWNTGGAR